MNYFRPLPYLVASFGVGLAVVLTSCGGGGGSSSTTPPGYAVHNLVSNSTSISAKHTDANLVNPWGIVFNPQGFVWVANNGTSTSTLYDGNGVMQPQPLVAIPNGKAGPAGPTGIVFNQSTDFSVSIGALSGVSVFIFDGEGGMLAGWSPNVAMNDAVTAYDDGSGGAIYKGLAIAQDSASHNFLYAADFHNAKVDVFDGTFTKTTAAGGFVDASVPAGYAPFGIQNIPASDGSAQIYVAYAKQDSGASNEVAGAGLGYLAVFDATGKLLKHLVSGGALNAPWGIALAPASFGPFSGDLLIANLGDGTINAFDSTGAMQGTLTQANGQQVQISGLWGIAFGNGLNSQPVNTLFFAAGPNGYAGGIYGRIDYDTSSSTMNNGGY